MFQEENICVKILGRNYQKNCHLSIKNNEILIRRENVKI